MTTVLVVDDEPTIREIVVKYLRRDGFRTLEAADGNHAHELVEAERPDLVVLDLMLPGIDGLELCRWIRERSSLPELAARVRTVLRRAELDVVADERLCFNGLVIDSSSRDVTRNDEPLRLTAREFDLLWFMASHPRRVFSREHLMRRVWGYASAVDTGTVTVHMRRLREKIEDDPSRPQHLETVWGVGYRFSP
jgi:DNA-binding response OmpR family regulator